MTQAQLEALAKSLGTLASVFVPTDAALLSGVIDIASELNGLISGIRASDPQVWARVVALNTQAEADWAASIAGK